MKKLHIYSLHFILVVLIALALRSVALSDFPVGMHHDEAWLGYNAFLLATNGTNLYGERWPLTVDMFGDNVSAMQSYMTVPAVVLFGLNVWSIRITIVFFSLVSLGLASLLTYRLSGQIRMSMSVGLLFAISTWNIIMTRASSTVIIDTAMVLSFLVAFSLALDQLFPSGATEDIRTTEQTKKWVLPATAWLALSYVFSIVAYFTYFTSRLVIVPMGCGLLVLYFSRYFVSCAPLRFEQRKQHPRLIIDQPQMRALLPKVALAVLPLLAYLVFPFLTMLPTPYALGRFKQTTVLESDLVKISAFENISRSGQAGLPAIVTRSLYNKFTVNFTEFARLYWGIFSPSLLLFNSGPPVRYELPGVGVVSSLEFLGLIVVIGIALVGVSAKSAGNKSSKHHLPFDQRWLALLLVWWLAVAAIPSALTLDDFPNLQRAVLMTPFLQMAAGLGLWQLATQIETVFKKFNWTVFLSQKCGESLYLVVILLLSLPSLISLILGYGVHARFDQPQFRHEAGELVSRWLIEHANEEQLLIDNKEGIFFLRFFLEQRNILDEPITKDGKYYSGTFAIGQTTYIDNLCGKEDIITREYRYLVLYTFNGCQPPVWFTKIYSAAYANGSEGFAVLEPDLITKKNLAEVLSQINDPLQRQVFIDELWKRKN